MARPAEALTSLLTGDGALYWCQHSGWASKSMVPNRLEIMTPYYYGAIVARGPGLGDGAVRRLHHPGPGQRREADQVTLLCEPEATAEAATDHLLSDPDLD